MKRTLGMKALFIISGLFFSICGALVIYFATSNPGHEYDLKFVLPIDARQMPNPGASSHSSAEIQGADPAGPGPVGGRAETQTDVPVPERPPFQFDEKAGAPSQARAQE
jgi:hypothetical protein